MLVSFKAVWCGPCKLIEPFLQEISTSFGDTLKVHSSRSSFVLSADNSTLQVVKVDVDEAPGLVKRYLLRGLPHIAVFKGGEKINGFEV